MSKQSLQIYIHIPFCVHKCAYCDFLSFYKSEEQIDIYIKKLIEEINLKKFLANNYIITSIYIGGGTPSFINAKYIDEIIKELYKNYDISKNCEISIEINPNSALYEKLYAYKKCNINRLSFGLQSANDKELKVLDRAHTFDDFLNSFNAATDIGFDNINVDIISAIPNQTPKSYENTLNKILKLNIQHISVYNLIIEPNTPFYHLYKNNKLNLPNEETIKQIDEITYNKIKEYKFNRYEISNYSKKNFECKHNLGYWDLVPYLSFGLNASSYMNNKRYKNISDFNKYLNLNFNKFYEDNINFYDEIIKLTKNDSMSEFMFLGLRKTNGINVDDFYKKFNENIYDIFKETLKKYFDLKLLIKDDNYIFLSPYGLDISNKILCDFIL